MAKATKPTNPVASIEQARLAEVRRTVTLLAEAEEEAPNDVHPKLDAKRPTARRAFIRLERRLSALEDEISPPRCYADLVALAEIAKFELLDDAEPRVTRLIEGVLQFAQSMERAENTLTQTYTLMQASVLMFEKPGGDAA